MPDHPAHPYLTRYVQPAGHSDPHPESRARRRPVGGLDLLQFSQRPQLCHWPHTSMTLPFVGQFHLQIGGRLAK